MARHKIGVVSSSGLIRNGLESVIARQREVTYTGFSEDFLSACRLITSTSPDVLVCDLATGGINLGFDLIQRLKRVSDKTGYLALGHIDSDLYRTLARESGASGYISLESSLEVIGNKILDVATMSVYQKNRLFGKELSERELEVLSLIGKGLTSAEIASSLGISTKTVETHYDSIEKKKGFNRMNSLLFYAFWNYSGDEGDFNFENLCRLTRRQMEVFSLISDGYDQRDISKRLYLSPKTVESHYESIKKLLVLRNTRGLMRYAVNWRKSQSLSMTSHNGNG